MKNKTLKTKLPIVKNFYNKVNFSESYYAKDGFTYDVPTMYAFAEEKSYPIFDLPLAGINLSHLMFKCDSLDYFIYQMLRVLESNLEHPILLDDTGSVADGNHRVCKAIIEGMDTIKAIRLEEMPKASGKTTESE